MRQTVHTLTAPVLGEAEGLSRNGVAESHFEQLFLAKYTLIDGEHSAYVLSRLYVTENKSPLCISVSLSNTFQASSESLSFLNTK
jgi:hypothetical protein